MNRIAYITDFETWKEGFSFSIDIKVRFSETDMFGHVNNISSFIYFEEARIAFFEQLGLITSLKRSTTVPIVSDLQCDYHHQMFFGNIITLYVKANEVGNSSLDVHYMGVNENEELCLTGRGRLVNLDSKTGKTTPLTKEQREKINHI